MQPLSSVLKNQVPSDQVSSETLTSVVHLVNKQAKQTTAFMEIALIRLNSIDERLGATHKRMINLQDRLATLEHDSKVSQPEVSDTADWRRQKPEQIKRSNEEFSRRRRAKNRGKKSHKVYQKKIVQNSGVSSDPKRLPN